MVDSMIRLFPSNATDFTTNGLGYLPDATECTVTEERNGIFELEMKYPVTGKRYKDILLRSLIVAKPNPYDDPQPFRVYEISRPMKNVVTIKAAHISYDLNGIPLSPGAGTFNNPPSSAFDVIKGSALVSIPFTFWTDKTNSGVFNIDKAKSVRAALGGSEGSILDVYRGEYKFDKFLIRLYSARGMNRGVSIRYGKNLTDLNQDENCENVYTGVYAYWRSEVDGTVTKVETSPKITPVPGNFDHSKILILDLTSEYEEKPTSAQLKTRAEQYIKDNDIGSPKISLDISFVNLMDSGEYETAALLETVHLCDTVTVIFEELGVNSTAKCIETVYNCITNTYEKISLGDAKSNLANTLANPPSYDKEFSDLENSIKDSIENANEAQKIAIAYATKLITGNLGGHVVLHSSTGGEKPDELLIMDTEDIKTAKRVWRWNLSGWGYSSTGYNGPYNLAATMSGMIVADFIQTGTMSANRIKGGTLSLGGSGNGNGVLMVYDSSNNQIGKWDNTGISAKGSFSMTYYNKRTNETFMAEMGALPGYIQGANITYGLKITCTDHDTNEIRSIYLRPPQWNTRDAINPPGLISEGTVSLIGELNDNRGGILTGVSKATINGTLHYQPAINLFLENNTYHFRILDAQLYNGDETGYFLALATDGITFTQRDGGNSIRFGSKWIKQTTGGNKLIYKNTIVLYDTSSSIRYKNVKRNLNNEDVDRLYNIQPVLAVYKEEYLIENDERYGVAYPMFIAENVDDYFPEAVNHNEDGSAENWNERIIIPAMFQMIKSQKSQIDQMQKQIDELKEMILNGK